jgi:succinoglycan biosynthesis protein ExoA
VWRPLWLVPADGDGRGIRGGLAIGAKEGAGVAVRVPPVLATMHLTWGLGFLRGTSED